MRKRRLCFIVSVFFTCVLWAAEQVPEPICVNPNKSAKVVVRHTLEHKRGTTYSYKIQRNSRGYRPTVFPSTPVQAISRGSEELFIDSADKLDALKKPDVLVMEWDCREMPQAGRAALGVPPFHLDGEFFMEVSAKKWGSKDVVLATYPIIIDTRPNPFDVEVRYYGDRLGGRSVFIRAVQQKGGASGTGESPTAHSWELTITDETGSIVFPSPPRRSAPTKSGEITFWEPWQPMWTAEDTARHSCVITLKGVDRAGNEFKNKAEYVDELTPMKAENIVRSETGDRFDIAIRDFDPLRLISGRYNPATYTFEFTFTYAQSDSSSPAISGVTITVYDEKNKNWHTMSRSPPGTGLVWDGRVKEEFIIQSNERYRFGFVFRNALGREYPVRESGALTTTLVTQVTKRTGPGEENICVPSVHFAGYDIQVFQRAYVEDNFTTLWKIAGLITKALDTSYSALVIRGYANPVNYPSRPKMAEEEPSLMRYSLARANGVRDVLVQMRVPADKIIVEPMGGKEPTWAVTPNAKDAYKTNYQNRRVEFYLKR